MDLLPPPTNHGIDIVGVADGGEAGYGQEDIQISNVNISKGKDKMDGQESMYNVDKEPPDKRNLDMPQQVPLDHSKSDNLDEYREPDSEDEYDGDTHYLGEGIETGEEINNSDQIQKGPLLHTSNVDDIRDITSKQGLSPREPFANSSQLDSYRMRLLMDYSYSNSNNKIWIFWSDKVKCQIVDMDQQHISCEVIHEHCSDNFHITYVYAKCKEYLRKPLRDGMLKWSTTVKPWCIIGDFNVITSTQEKCGGRAYNINKSLEFINIIESCGLTDLGYHGQYFTWCNHRKDGARIWKRLDRGMVNDKWMEKMPKTTITHFPSVGSDHCPLLMEISDNKEHVIRYFKFLNCWTENYSFLKTVESCWKRQVEGKPMWKFHTKMKRLTATLRYWSKKEYGDVFAKVKEYEELISSVETSSIQDNSKEKRENLHYVNAQYIKYLKLEYVILQQKTQLHWLKEGDANSKYFHAVLRGRRKK
ncbi:uncharacterized protein [Solanum lycopersicum]|uniref:uncharacterized protein n=1 Tax=Solanum lycopersicum TaxID=4081 RepID=UPI000532E1B1|nr:uncharacterized protein LOC104648721 [Solanum lycopersicum]